MKSLLTLLIPAVVLVAPAYAGETGNLRGKVVDGQGITVPGATITITGSNIAGEITTVTSNDGSFQIVSIPPGKHTVIVTKPNFTTVQYNANIRLDETSYLDATIRVGDAAEVIMVEDTLPVIDTSRSAVSTSLSADFIQNLPVGRSYQDAVNTVAGVYGRVDTQDGGGGSGNPSVRGEGSYGNNYLMDGISTRDPATKTFSTNINFDAIEEIQVYTDGLPAEFSQATGMLVNVVTKDGADEHFGSAGYWLSTDTAPNLNNDTMEKEGFGIGDGTYPILDFEAGEETEKEKRHFFNQEFSGTVGGPIIDEKLWYFGSFNFLRSNTEFEGVDPDSPYISDTYEGFGKVTWFVTPDVTLQYQLGAATSSIDNYVTNGLYADEAQAQYKSGNMTHIGTFRWRPGQNNELVVKGSMLTSTIDVIPMASLDSEDDPPAIFDTDTGQYLGNYDSYDYNTRTRLGTSVKFTQFVGDFLGEHRIKVGGEYWKLTDNRELIFTGTDAKEYFPGVADGASGEDDAFQFQRSDELGYPCTEASGYTDCQGYTGYTNLDGGLGHEGRIMGAFIQDDWSPVDPLTLNLGVRVDKEQLLQNTGTVVLDQIMPAPRLGAAWDITNDSKTLLTVNYGRYYDLNGNDFAAWADTKNSFVYREYQNDGAGNYDLVWEQDPTTDPLIYCTEDSIDSYSANYEDYGYDDAQTFYDAIWEDACNSSALAPYHTDKFVMGLEREIVPLFALGVKGILSTTRNLPEDIDYDLDIWAITNPENKRRDYRGIEFTAERKYDGRWQLLGSYTLAESKGTSPGQFEIASGGQTGSDGNNVGVYLDDVSSQDARDGFLEGGNAWLLDGLAGLGTLNDDAGYYGYLPYHSFHMVKLAGSYTLGTGTTLGAVYEFDSGHAWQKRGYVDLYGDYFAFPEGRGTRFMPAVHYFDVRAAHEFSFADRYGLEVSLDVFNILDLEQAITYYENDTDLFGMTMYRQAPRSIRAGMRFTY